MSRDQSNSKTSWIKRQRLAQMISVHPPRVPQYQVPAQYPKVQISGALAHPTFSKLVTEVADSVDLADAKLFPEGIRRYFQLVHSDGLRAAMKLVWDELGASDQSEAAKVAVLSYPARYLGEVLVQRILEKDPDAFPTNDVEVFIHDDLITLGLSSMHRRKTDGTTVYHSRSRLSVEHAGKEYIVAFTKHAIDAICERFKPNYKSYTGLGDAHALFSYLAYTELVQLTDGNLAVAIFDLCVAPGFWEYENYVRRCLPGAEQRGFKQLGQSEPTYGYRVGYCPIAFSGQYAVAKTFLSPGFRSTPERQLIRAKARTRAERDRLENIAEKIDYHTLRHGDAMEAIVWFHQNGVPQAIDPPVPLFDAEYLMRKSGQR